MNSMVHLIPHDRVEEEMNNSGAEWILYNKFKTLNDDYYVFHSLNIPVKEKNSTYLEEKEIDFIIFNPYYGILCLEVKGGSIQGKNNRIYQAPRNNPENFHVINPIQQIKKPKYQMIKELRNQYPPNFTSYAVNTLTWFVDVEEGSIQGTLPMDYKLYSRTLWKEHTIDIEKSLVSVFENQLVKRPFTEKNCQAIPAVLNTIAPKFNAIMPLQDIFKYNKKMFLKMTENQIKVMSSLKNNRHVFVEGLAGSGKSLMALASAKNLTQNNNKVLLICFNKLLKEEFKNNLKDYHNSISVMNIYDLSREITGKIPGNFYASEQVKLLDYIISNIQVFDFNHIIVDEAQDFTGDILSRFYRITQIKEGNFHLFFDRYQKHTNNDSIEWITNQDYAVQLKLNDNCRNTIQISKVSTELNKEKPMESKYNINGRVPKIFLNDKDTLLKKLSEQIKYYYNQSIPLENMVILTLSNADNILIESITGVNVSLVKKENHILYTTARKFKGLEADIVFILDASFNLFNNEVSKNLFYIALSRAHNIVESFMIIDVPPNDYEISILEKKYSINFERN